MTTSTIEEKTQAAAGTAPEPKATVKAKATKRKPAGAPAKAKSAKMSAPLLKSPNRQSKIPHLDINCVR